MLNELKAVHAELDAAIAALDAACAAPAPDAQALPYLRLSLSRVSSRRKALIDQMILPRLSELPADLAARVDALRRRTATISVESTEHIARWTMATIHADWAGYCRASAAMRDAMRRRMREEAELLYPLLAERSGLAA